ncbi:hypothetical protein HDF24_04485 [Mucilaginibacter sp. X4EP1]|uniref:hypothetical protein n=1 Tax=Mucilaginibacter sp. X4EP1 TaxID=2723092 RepID=UPI00216AA0EF|nr:hypothetical protein [Mucilaginibacter sp. X4EP1]MCS3816247.1 hypothetical protein [Mucilaginibacter sp. X4EP1]
MTTIVSPDIKIKITGSGSKEQVSEALKTMANDISSMTADEITNGGTFEDHILCMDYEQETCSGELNIGDLALVPEPNGTDIHMHEFSGYIKSFRGDNAIVEDADGDCFEIEIERLTLI